MRNRTTIHIPLPENIDSQYKTLYEKKSSYTCPELFVKEYSNVFVSHEGLCFQHFRLLPYSSFNICTCYDRSFGWQYYTLVLEQYIVSTFGKSLQKMTLDEDKAYAIIHTKWFNYSFWITSSLVRLQMLVDSGKPFVLLYPEEWDAIPYVQQTLQAFPSIEKKRIPAGVHIQVPHLLLPEVRPFTACYDMTNTLRNLSNFLIDHKFGSISEPKGVRVYLNRNKAKYRKVQNEAEVENLLQNFQFISVDFDTLSFWEQVDLMRKTECFVSIHGAGFSNMMFLPRKAKVLELINEVYAKTEYTFPFWREAISLGIIYYSQFCMPNRITNVFIDVCSKNAEDAIVNQNILVDIPLLEQNIKRMIEK